MPHTDAAHDFSPDACEWDNDPAASAADDWCTETTSAERTRQLAGGYRWTAEEAAKVRHAAPVQKFTHEGWAQTIADCERVFGKSRFARAEAA